MDGLFLQHYGVKRRSGRYPWGSGEDPYQHEKGFNGYVRDLMSQGWSETDIAKGLGMTTTELRKRISIASTEQKKENISRALELRNKGYSPTEIGRRMDVNESTVRGWLKDGARDKANSLQATTDILRSAADSKKYIDIGVGSERWMGISRTKLLNSVEMLKDEGYTVHYLQVDQMGTDKKTSMMVLSPPGTEWKDVNANKDQIQLVGVNSSDNGKTFDPISPPVSLSSNRLAIQYGDEGGSEKDGLIEIRRGVDDISLGKANYAQVRIAVDGTHYLKGMAAYSDDLPEGIDVRFNTNKPSGTPIMSNNKNDEQVLKMMKSDPENPFGASIKRDDELILAQRYYTDKDGNRKQSVMNIVNEEGNWDTWGKSLSSQMLSKQPTDLAKKQLDLYYAEKKDEYDEIMSLTNPTVKKILLQSFSDDCDSAASDLKAAALPRQRTQVILPVTTLKDNEIYAPNFRPGEEVALIRYPHGGTFEIPVLKVTDKNIEAKKMIGQGIDAVGINHKVAQTLSGADFDGDTVIVIPTKGINIHGAVNEKHLPDALKDLRKFDPQASYPGYEGMRPIKSKTKQTEMGKVSNLITDMTIKGAPIEDICKAVKHSMVVIDAEKHNLDYRRSYIENDIAYLKEKYQGSSDAGASTLISKAGSEVRIKQRKEGILVTDPETGNKKRLYIDPYSGKKLYEETGETYFKPVKDKSGNIKGYKEIDKLEKATRMSLVDDAYSLSSGTRMEAIYANHANKLKDLANRARKEYLATPSLEYSPSAKKTYSREVKSLDIKLDTALKNAPLERKAQTLAGLEVSIKKKNNPELINDYDALKKVKGQAIIKARIRTGAHKDRIDISSGEWEAIQAGAVSNSKLMQILKNTDMDKVKELAMPRSSNEISNAKVARAKSMLASGFTQAQIADQLGISPSTINQILKGD